jgi:hypothetical protein
MKAGQKALKSLVFLVKPISLGAFSGNHAVQLRGRITMM